MNIQATTCFSNFRSLWTDSVLVWLFYSLCRKDGYSSNNYYIFAMISIPGKRYWKIKRLEMFLSQASPKDFLGLILVVLLSSVDFTEERIVEKLFDRFTDDPYFSSLFDLPYYWFLILFFMRLYTDLLQHWFLSPIPLQFFLFFEHWFM